MKQFYATCVGYSGDIDELSNMIDDGKEISKATFFKACEKPEPLLAQTMKEFPNDYTYYRGTGKDKGIYWFTWSCIEHFYK